MKKIFLPILLLISTFSFAQTVCVPGTQTSTASAYILPDSTTNLNHGCPGLNYFQYMYLKAAKDTTINATLPLVGAFTITAKIDSFVVDANITGLPSYLTVESNPTKLLAAGAAFPKSNYDRLVIKGDSLACVKISGLIPSGTLAGTNNLNIQLRIYLSNMSSTNVTADALIPNLYPGRKLDTTTNFSYYKIIIDAQPCYPVSISNLDKYNFDLIGNAPNPFTGNTTISFQSAVSKNFDLKIMSATGAIVYAEKVKSQIGMNYINIDGSKLSSGMYMILLNDDKNRLTKKMQVK